MKECGKANQEEIDNNDNEEKAMNYNKRHMPKGGAEKDIENRAGLYTQTEGGISK